MHPAIELEARLRLTSPRRRHRWWTIIRSACYKHKPCCRQGSTTFVVLRSSTPVVWITLECQFSKFMPPRQPKTVEQVLRRERMRWKGFPTPVEAAPSRRFVCVSSSAFTGVYRRHRRLYTTWNNVIMLYGICLALAGQRPS